MGMMSLCLSRKPSPAKWRTVAWDAETLGDWVREFDGADVVINLAGRSVNSRYNAANRKQILDSRTRSTRVVGEAILKSDNPPSIWLQSSTATIYSHRYDAANDDITGIIGGDEPNVPDSWRFSIDVAKQWEAAATAFELPKTRLVLLRSAMVMSRDPGGVFDTLRSLVRKRLGGTNGDGRQYVSWIHAFDFVNAIRWLMTHPELSGPINICSPNPLPNREFMRELRHACGISLGLPATKWMLEIGAIFMRTETELLLKSRRVVPTRLLESGFTFEYAKWIDAVRELQASTFESSS